MNKKIIHASLSQKFETIRGFLLWRRVRTIFLPILLAIASLSVLFHGLTEIDRPDVLHLEIIILSVALMLLHCVYLLTMTWQIVYRHTVDRYLGLTPLVLVLITLAYGILAVKSMLHGDSIHTEETTFSYFSVISFILFSLAYFVLWQHGRHELSHEEFLFPRTKESIKYFIKIDLIFFLSFTVYAGYILISPYFQHLLPKFFLDQGSNHPLTLVSLKDVLILTSLVAYWSSQNAVAREMKSKTNLLYKNYLKHVSLEEKQPTISTFNSNGNSEPAWFDYGCGSGQRIKELLTICGAVDVTIPSEIFFFDTDESQYDNVENNLGNWLRTKGIKYNYIHGGVPGPQFKESIQKADVIVLSHLTYNPTTTFRVLKSLESVREGSLLLIRVTAPTGLFRVISTMFSQRVFVPTYRHTVPNIMMSNLEKMSFNQIHRLQIKQRYAISEEESKRDLASWCDLVYGESAGMLVYNYIVDVNENGVNSIPNDDEVYLLRRQSQNTTFNIKKRR